MNKRFGNIIPKVLLAVLLLTGGAAMAQRNTPSYVSVGGNVFGGGKKANVGGNTSVVIDQSDAIIGTANNANTGDVYGGGEEAKVNTLDGTTYTDGKSASVLVHSGTVRGNVFGGGRGTTGVAADVLGPATVTIEGGTVITGVYGANNVNGNVGGDVEVVITAGTIGSSENLHQTTPVVAKVCGGGYGQNTSTSGDVEVNIGDETSGPTIYGDVYGGSAFGNVNTQGGTNTTTVNIMNGTLETVPETGQTSHVIQGNTVNVTYTIYHGGNVYGGGFGQKAEPYNPAVEDDPDTKCLDESLDPSTGIEAKVYGDVTVNIGTGSLTLPTQVTNEHGTIVHLPGFALTTEGYATIKGNIYGCNNQNGAPQKSVTVNVFATAHTSTDTYVYDPDPQHEIIPTTFAIANVFGGSNEANFVTGVTPKVNIYGCDNTIERTFGGCDAAASNTVHTMIQGGYIREAYAGGNGEVSPANVCGNVEYEIHGGKIGATFQGSNLQGDIAGSVVSQVDTYGDCGDSDIEEFYCGGNFADFHGDIDATIYCADGLYIHDLYGGCKQADVLPSGNQIGNVHLVVEGGTYDNIFGGSQGRLAGTSQEHPGEESADIAGSILLEIHGGKVNNAIYGGCHILGKVKGTITVNIENMDGSCGLDVSTADVYGGGNEADYDTAPTTGEHGYPYTHPNYPVINIKNATVRNVYGGGYKAKVMGNPQIHLKKGAKVLGNVYGGGNMGEVDGQPKVNIDGKNTDPNPHVIPTPHHE